MHYICTIIELDFAEVYYIIGWNSIKIYLIESAFVRIQFEYIRDKFEFNYNLL